MMFLSEELIKVTGAEVLKNTGNICDYNISTDTRTICSDDIYLPLSGENFDGENFINDALKKGSKAYFTVNDKVYSDADLVLKVDNTKDAYLKLANFYRKKYNPKVVAITGSAGKTTTKEMIYSVLNYKFKTHKTFSNHNNEIGFCQTVLSMPKNTQMLIVEMGMRGLGEIELISKYSEPDIAVITNCGTAHIGRLGSVDNIAAAKCEIATGLNKNGTFISLDQPIIKKHLEFDGHRIFYSLKDVKIIEKQAGYTKFEYNGNLYELNTEGEYNIENSLSAIIIGEIFGMTPEEISQGLKNYHPIEKRWEVENIDGLNFINDSYNANPESMKASVKTFVELYKKPVVVLGDMGELGTDEIMYHKKVGEFLSELNHNVHYLLVGNLAQHIGHVLTEKGINAVCLENNSQAAEYLVKNFNKDNTIFLKASRSMKFEEILEEIKEMRNIKL